MRILKLFLVLAGISGFVVIGFLLFRKVEEPCIGCGDCDYKPFVGEGFVSGFELDQNDSLIQLNFTLRGDNMSCIWIHHREVLADFSSIVTGETLRDTSVFYTLRGEKIHSGSCQPYLIESVSKLDKNE